MKVAARLDEELVEVSEWVSDRERERERESRRSCIYVLILIVNEKVSEALVEVRQKRTPLDQTKTAKKAALCITYQTTQEETWWIIHKEETFIITDKARANGNT
jgi:hypothetical protein